ncbi:HrpJ domain-containing protein [Aquibium microcysteis]|uniref:HrpJ domain-containing protein n=1 Tax=Aquibium microcysteis TaxID=675281 RepID=UPI00165D1BA2|nr:HrpJ domain-containing protein [Aquibium microcysteis]
MSDINSSRAPLEMVRTQIATHNAASEIGTRMLGQSSVTQERVSMGGVDQSDISDAMEELGGAVAHREKPKLEQTKLRKGAGTSLDAMSRIAQYQDKLPDQPRDQRLRDLKDRMDEFQRLTDRGGSGSNRPTAEDILKALAKYDKDPSHQFAALEQLRKQMVQLGASDAFLSVLDQARGRFHQGQTARDVTAGFAVGQVSHDMSEVFDADPSSIRDAYRTIVRENLNLGQIFDQLKGFNLAGSYDEIIESFTRVAARELEGLPGDSDVVTVGETRQILGGLLDELSKLKRLKTVLSESEIAVQTILRVHPELRSRPDLPDGKEMASRLLHFAANPSVSVGDVERLISGLNTDDPATSVTAVNTIRNTHSTLPDSVMPSMIAREQQSRAILDLSTRLVAREEAYFDSQSH